MSDLPKVYQAIANVTAALGSEGISKDRKNQQQGYAFRGIDDVYNALSSHLAENKLCILPTVLERDCVERTTAKGSALFYVTVKTRFDFVSAEDGSTHSVTTYGEAMDSADKATNKAMSAAYKYAAMQAFCIPTEGDNDADSNTHDVKGRQHKAAPPSEKQITEITKQLNDAAKNGKASFSKVWKASAGAVRDIIAADKAKMKTFQEECAKADKAKAPSEPDPKEGREPGEDDGYEHDAEEREHEPA